MAVFDEWKFLAGLGIFLFGMFMMEESIKLLAGRSFKALIRRFTGTRLKGLISGIVSTAILQSSSAVSLMVLAFVGAGLMTLINAIAVILGTNVGTTFTAWIVAVVGFSLKIDAFALPLIGTGGLGLIFLSGSARGIHASKLTAAFGFLFLGLDYMKTSVEAFAAAFDLSLLPDLGLWVYILAGLLLTAIMQSSSATIAIVLTALFSGIIEFRQGAGMVIGANIGTTVTVLLGSIGGGALKKQVAASSLLFNVGTALAVLPLLPLLFRLILDGCGLADNAVLGIALFHTLFNCIGVLLFFPLTPLIARSLEQLFPEKRTRLTRHIHKTSVEVPEAAVAALRKEIGNQLVLSMRYVAGLYDLRPRPQERADMEGEAAGRQRDHKLGYTDIERLHAEIFAFFSKLQSQAIDPQEAVQLEPVIRASRSIMNATRNFRELQPEIGEIGGEDNLFLNEAYRHLLDRIDLMWIMVEKVRAQPESVELADELDRFFRSVEENDKQFIRSCSGAIARQEIQEYEVTKLLMINRFLTQSCRMLVLSMQTLTKKENHGAPPLGNGRTNGSE